MESSGLRRMVSPAGFASAAEASSARPRNAPPMPRERAPGLPKLNWRPERDSMSVFCAAAGRAASNASKRKVLRMERRIALGQAAGRRLASRRDAGAPSVIDHCRHHFVRCAELLGAILSPAPLDHAVGEALRADGDPQREA